MINLKRLFPFLFQSIENFHDHLADLKVKNHKVLCANNLFLIAALPKSGSTWLTHLLSVVPGMVQLDRSKIRDFPQNPKLIHPHDISFEMLNSAPPNCLSFLKLHLNPYPRNFYILESFNAKTIVLIRDLRDVLISRLYHIILMDDHWDKKRLLCLPEESRLIESMKGIVPQISLNIIDYFSFWISTWIDRVSSHPNETLIIKYEDMKTDLFSVMKSIFKFYDYKISDEGIKAVILKQSKVHKNDRKRSLKNNLKLTGRSHSTFRKGSIGEWQNEFDQEIIDYFKLHAGEVLIESGYENDLSW